MVRHQRGQGLHVENQLSFVDARNSVDGSLVYGSWDKSFKYNLNDSDDEEEFRLLSERGSLESGTTSPPLWKNTASSISRSVENSPVHSRNYYYHDNRYLGRQVCSTARAQQIARYRQDMIDIVRNMPENYYELSLRDMVQTSSPRISRTDPKMIVNERETLKEDDRKPITNKGTTRLSQNEKIETRVFLLKMFMPKSLAGERRKKDSRPSTNAKVSSRSSFSENIGGKVSPRPSINGKDRLYSSDNEWWSSKPGGRGNSSSSGSSGSSNSSNSRRRKLINCYSFLHRSKTSEI